MSLSFRMSDAVPLMVPLAPSLHPSLNPAAPARSGDNNDLVRKISVAHEAPFELHGTMFRLLARGIRINVPFVKGGAGAQDSTEAGTT
jgi:hypothetical protein